MRMRVSDAKHLDKDARCSISKLLCQKCSSPVSCMSTLVVGDVRPSPGFEIKTRPIGTLARWQQFAASYSVGCALFGFFEFGSQMWDTTIWPKAVLQTRAPTLQPHVQSWKQRVSSCFAHVALMAENSCELKVERS